MLRPAAWAQMFKLWSLAEGDLLAEGNAYRLTNTGQGLNRVQQAPAVSHAMHAILARCQRVRTPWRGTQQPVPGSLGSSAMLALRGMHELLRRFPRCWAMRPDRPAATP